MLGENRFIPVVMLRGKQCLWKQGQLNLSLILEIKAMGLGGAIHVLNQAAVPRASQRGMRTAKALPLLDEL